MEGRTRNSPTGVLSLCTIDSIPRVRKHSLIDVGTTPSMTRARKGGLSSSRDTA